MNPSSRIFLRFLWVTGDRCTSENVSEGESHLMFHCSCYDNIRQNRYIKIENIYPEFQDCIDGDKLQIIMREEGVKFIATYVWEAFSKRRAVLFKHHLCYCPV